MPLAAALAAGAAGAQELPGDRSLYLLDVPFLHFGPLPFDDLAAGRAAITLSGSYANTFSHTWHARALHVERHVDDAPFTREEAERLHERHPNDTIAFLDGEVTRVALRAAVGLGRGASVALEIPWISWNAVGLDGDIEAFHRVLGLPSSQRDDFPRGRFEVVQQRPGGPLEFQDMTPRAGLGDAVVSLRKLRALGPRTFASAELAVKLPTGDADEWRGSGSLDAGLLVGLRHEVARAFDARLEAGAVAPGRFRGNIPATFHPVPFLRLLGGVTWRAGAGTSLSLAAVLEQSPERKDSRGDAGGTSLEATLGLAHRIGDRAEATLALTENLPKYGDAADVALRLSVRLLP